MNFTLVSAESPVAATANHWIRVRMTLIRDSSKFERVNRYGLGALDMAIHGERDLL